MNVLEKILGEIEEATYQEDAPIYIGDMAVDGYVRMGRVEEIIRSHMDDCKTFEFDFTGVKSFDCQCGRHYVNTCNDDWIPVEERLPEVQEGLEDMYCPEFNVTIKGVTETTTLKYSWDGTWFDNNGYVYNVIAWQPLPEAYIHSFSNKR